MLAGRVNRTAISKETAQKRVNFKSLHSNFSFDFNKVQSHTTTSTFSLFELFSDICFLLSLFYLEHTHKALSFPNTKVLENQESELAFPNIRGVAVNFGVKAEGWGSRLACPVMCLALWIHWLPHQASQSSSGAPVVGTTESHISFQ